MPSKRAIRSAITDFLRQQDEKDYLSEVEMRIATAINRLGLFVSQSKAKVTAYMDANDRLAEPCPKCGTGHLKCKEGKKGLFWYCTNWNAAPKCSVTFPDDGGRPLFPAGDADDQ